MALDPYTHKFEFALGDGSFIEGDCEFNSDGKASFKMNTWSEPIPLETIEEFEELMWMVKRIFEHNSGVKKILVKEKKE